MKVFRSAALLCACLPIVTAMVAQAAGEPPAKPVGPVAAAGEKLDAAVAGSALEGMWRLDKREGKMWSSQINTYKSDGSFSSVIGYDAGKGVQKLTVEGKWTIEGHKITYQISKSSDTAASPADAKSTDTIVDIDGIHFRYFTDDGVEEIETRATEAEPKEPDAKLGYTIAKISLYQPDDQIGKRVAVKDLREYLKVASAECVRYFAASAVPENLNIVIAMRPGKQSKVWLEPESAAHPERAALIKKLESLPVMEVKDGPIAVALVGSIGGGLPKPADAPPLPVPKEWKEGSENEKAAIGLDVLLQKIWP